MINKNVNIEEDFKGVLNKEIEEKNINNKINIENNNGIESKKLNEEEILKAKENGFILIGKTGVGKTTLLNLIYGDNIGKVGYSTESETKKSNYYCIKEKVNSEDIYFCIIDTPGLFDTNGIEKDKKQKEDIQNLISKEKIKIKGLLFLSNFQNERFDYSEQDTLIQYNAIFPLKEFWKRIILIFTHYYGDPNGESKEDIKKKSNEILSNIFDNIMNKVKQVSNPINFFQIKKKYVNIYSKPKNNKQIESNEEYKKGLISDIVEYANLCPMFSKLQIFQFEKYEIEENDGNIYDCDLKIYLDSNDNVIYKEFDILGKYPKKDFNIKDQVIKYDYQKCEIDEEGNLIKINTKKEGLKEIFSNSKSKFGGALTIFSIIGLIFSGLFFHFGIPVCLTTLAGGSYFIKKSVDEHKEDEDNKINQIIEDEKIKEDFKNELEKKGWNIS